MSVGLRRRLSLGGGASSSKGEGMGLLYVALSEEEIEQLVEIARMERRKLKDQAAVFILQGIQAAKKAAKEQG